MAKSKDTKRISVTISEELYAAVKAAAREDKRSISQEICHLVECALVAFAQADSQDEDEEEEEPTADAIGFKINGTLSEEDEDDDE